MVAITGYVKNLVGGVVDDFVLFAKPQHPFYSGNVLMSGGAIPFFPATGDGLIEMELPETETLEQLIGFYAKFTAEGIYQEIHYSPVLIPNVVSIGLNELLNPIIA